MKKIIFLILPAFLISVCYAASPNANILVCPQNVNGVFDDGFSNVNSSHNTVIQNGIVWTYNACTYPSPSVTIHALNTNNQVQSLPPGCFAPATAPYVSCQGVLPDGTIAMFTTSPVFKGYAWNFHATPAGQIGWTWVNPQK